jgi:putative phosphoribosyl transferase
VLFAHASGVGRSSSGSQRTVSELEEQGLAVLTFDLLSADEQEEAILTGGHLLGVPLAASRFLEVAAWAGRQPELCGLPIGLLGSGRVSASALVAAAEGPATLAAVVCQSGRVDMAGSALAQVQAPTLFLVGGDEASLVRCHESALVRLGSARKELVVIPGGSSVLDEPGAREAAADLTAEWFSQNLILAS